MIQGKKRNPIKTIGCMLICLILAVCIGTLLLCGAYSLPTKPIYDNVQKSAVVFEKENTYQILFSWCTSMLDNFTDAYMLLGAADQTEAPVLEKAMMNYPGIHTKDPRQELTDHFINGEPLVQHGGYARYWHGYQIWLKPLLSFTTYQGIRIINAVLQSGLVILACILFYRKKIKKVIFPFILTWLMLMPAALAESLQFSACFYVAVVSMIALLPEKPGRYSYVFLFSGIATAYFDLLTYPVFTFGMPAVLYFAMNPLKTSKEEIGRFVWIGFCWVLGYAGMWAMKWAAGSLLTGRNIFSDALGQLRIRTSDLSQDNVTHVSWFECAARNILWFVTTPATILTGCYCVWNCFPFSGRRSGDGTGEGISEVHILPYLLVALVPFVWFAVTINHSYMHIFFVNKTLAMSVFAATVWITGFYPRIRSFRETRKQKQGPAVS